jgi:competence protein ComEA
MSAPVYRIAITATLALLAVAIIAPAVILLSRGDDNAPIQIIAPSAGEAAALAQPDNLAASLPAQVPPDLRVYISGAVQTPGVYSLQAGDRLVDALEAAGGPTAEADLTAVNLARRAQDEEHYYIPRVGETPLPIATVTEGLGAVQSTIAPGAGDGKGLIDLNTASADALATLPGIGPVKAQAIIAYREQNGRFQSIDQITEVSGIGPATYEKIRGLVTIGAP